MRAAGYVHVDVVVAQESKHEGRPCGDVTAREQTIRGATFLCADGIGAGVNARIAARMCASRLLELQRHEFSLQKAFLTVARTMEHARDPSKPFAAFSVGSVRPDGTSTVLSYDAPPPIYVGRQQAVVLPGHAMELEGALVRQYHCHLERGEGLLLMSDGVTQAGLGTAFREGWLAEGVARFVGEARRLGADLASLPKRVVRAARDYWGRGGDDCTALLAGCRRGQIVNILTGPPTSDRDDHGVVRRFMARPGLKIVCGGTTAEIVAEVLDEPLRMEQNPTSLVAPPRSRIDGVDLVTEGAVTLNQVYNLLDEDVDDLREDSGVTELCALLNVADRVNITVGGADNEADNRIALRQQGILARRRVIPLLIEKLRAAGKLVVEEYV